MKPSEKEILDTLRKTTLAYLSESDYAQIEKAVEQKGILNLTGTTSILVKSAVQKHGGGGHDQASHGSWAGNGAGGKNIQDMSASDQKEFIDRMSSAKSGAEQRAIIEEFKGRQKGGTKGGVDSMTQTSLNRGKKALEGNNYKAMMADYDKMEVRARKKLDKPFDPENEEYGDPQDLAQTDFYRKYGASVMDVQMYAEALPSGVKKAVSVKTGDMVSWNSSGGTARGKVVRVISSGKINVPDSSFSIEGSEDDPAALIQLYRDGKPTETKVGHKVSTLKKKLK